MYSMRLSHITYIYTIYLITQVLTEGPLILVEGGVAVYVAVQPTLPPSYLCDAIPGSSPCWVHIEAHMDHRGDDFSCASGMKIAQAVIGWEMSSDVNDSFCGVPVSVNNWEQVLHIPVKAMSDGLFDQDVTRSDIISRSIKNLVDFYVLIIFVVQGR